MSILLFEHLGFLLFDGPISMNATLIPHLLLTRYVTDLGALIAPVLQGGVLAVIIGEVFKLVSDSVSAKQKKNQFRFEHLYPKQADIIEALYLKLAVFEERMSSLANPLQWGGQAGHRQNLEDAGKAGADFVDYLSKHRIYLSEEANDILDQILQEYTKVYTMFNAYLMTSSVPAVKEWTDSWTKVKDEIPQLRKKLEEDFRTVFGI